MENQTYKEVMAKLAEAQNCQNEIINCNNLSQEIIRERDNKLNEALSKGWDIVNDEVCKNMYNLKSLGSQALGHVYRFMALYNIRIQNSAEVQAKIAKFTANGLRPFPFNTRWFGR